MPSEVFIPLAGIALPMVLVPTIMAMRQAGKKREYEHIERMKALETGQPVPGEVKWVGAMVCAAIGAGVPFGAFLFTFLSYVNSPNPPGEIWMAPVVVSFFALVGAVKIGAYAFRPSPPAKVEAAALNGTPHYDPDAYETVGR